ncbi:hypothetical protein DKB58_03370 [Capnocytophaga canimorsus]|uniref:hypothetical protein n=1 Tax=Capnocytophaga canimorsus TaxID=28188 RepID=UPI000D6E4991|nr:hypothetical protein [Capnocytophaga canimorsus]AWL78053.1 hypothetical protein DKB58_03370 [Capnocytophaga canimorsus]
MSRNLISVVLPEQVTTQVSQKLQEIKELLAPYMGNLTLEERASLPKMGDKTLVFVSKVSEYINSNPKFVPSMLNTEEFKKDFSAHQGLLPILAVTQQVVEQLKDTTILTGHEAYVQALYYYGNVKLFAKTGDAEAKAIYEDLGKRFPKGKKGAKPEAPTL